MQKKQFGEDKVAYLSFPRLREKIIDVVIVYFQSLNAFEFAVYFCVVKSLSNSLWFLCGLPVFMEAFKGTNRTYALEASLL